MHGYRIERISPTNLKYVRSLHKSIYGRGISLKQLLGKYNTTAFGAEWIGFLAFAPDNNPAAFYGVIPCHFELHSERFLAAQSADTMTHPDHQKKGLFIWLAKKTYELAKEEGIQFIFGFPNQNSYGGFVKLGWQFLATPMQLFVLKGSKVPLAAAMLKIFALKKIYKNLMEDSFNTSESGCNFSSENGVVRDSVFFKYKAQYSHTFIKKWDEIEGWLKNDGVLKVGALRFKQVPASKQVLSYLQQTAKKLGCHSVILMTSPNTQLHKTLSEIIPSKDGLPIGFFNLTNRNLNFHEVKFEYCDIDIF